MKSDIIYEPNFCRVPTGNFTCIERGNGIMSRSPLFSLRSLRILTVVVLVAALAADPGCSAEPQEEQTTPTPVVTPTPTITPSPTPVPTVEATPEPTPTATPAPTPAPVFPEMEKDDEGGYIFPQVVADKQSVMTGEPVYFKIITSEKVNSVQTVIDGETGKIYTDYDSVDGVRIWITRIFFTSGGTRKVQYKCSMATGGTVLIPKDPLKVDVTFDYTAQATSKTITKGKTVTFTLKTPDSIDSIYVVVDGVNQNIKYDEFESSEDGVKVWMINVTFFGLGEREVTFEAHDGSKVVATFPDPGLPIIVEDSI